MFQVPGMGLMAAMAHRSTASGSGVYLWSHTGFQLYQNITTYGALAWRHFSMGKKVWQKGLWIDAYTHLVKVVWGADIPCVSLLPSRFFWWCLTLGESHTSVLTKNQRWTSLWFTSGAKKENGLCGFRLCRRTAHGTGRPLTSIDKLILLWPIIDKVKTKYPSNDYLLTSRIHLQNIKLLCCISLFLSSR